MGYEVKSWNINIGAIIAGAVLTVVTFDAPIAWWWKALLWVWFLSKD